MINLMGDAYAEDLPEMLIGRHNHSMVTLMQKYLYVFGGIPTL